MSKIKPVLHASGVADAYERHMARRARSAKAVTRCELVFDHQANSPNLDKINAAQQVQILEFAELSLPMLFAAATSTAAITCVTTPASQDLGPVLLQCVRDMVKLDPNGRDIDFLRPLPVRKERTEITAALSDWHLGADLQRQVRHLVGHIPAQAELSMASDGHRLQIRTTLSVAQAKILLPVLFNSGLDCIYFEMQSRAVEVILLHHVDVVPSPGEGPKLFVCVQKALPQAQLALTERAG